MSAFVCSDAHLSLLVDALRSGPESVVSPDNQWDCRWTLRIVGASHDGSRTVYPRRMTADDLYALLWRENVRSVAYRYSEPEAEYEMGRYRSFPYRMTPEETLAAVACYRYQACETPDWPTTEAALAMDALVESTIRALPGYRKAPWEWTEATIAERMAGSTTRRLI